MIKYIFSDLDGTLMLSKDEMVNEPYIPMHNKKAILQAQSSNIAFWMCTGRPVSICQQIVAHDKLNLGIIGQNGFQAIDETNNELFNGENDAKVRIQYLEKIFSDDSLDFLSFSKQTDPMKYYYKDENHACVQRRIQKYYKMAQGQKITLEEAKLLANDFTNLTVLFENTKEKIKKMNQLDQGISEAYLIATLDDSADVISDAYSKLKAIKQIMKLKGIDKSEVAFFGDGYNDFECLSYFENSFCMFHAPQDIKDVSGHVVDSVAEAIDIILTKK